MRRSIQIGIVGFLILGLGGCMNVLGRESDSHPIIVRDASLLTPTGYSARNPERTELASFAAG